MRECAWCGIDSDSQIGFSQELKTVHWGGKKNGTVEYSPKIVYFFCREEHRAEFLVSPMAGVGEIQTDRWLTDGED